MTKLDNEAWCAAYMEGREAADEEYDAQIKRLEAENAELTRHRDEAYDECRALAAERATLKEANAAVLQAEMEARGLFRREQAERATLSRAFDIAVAVIAKVHRKSTYDAFGDTVDGGDEADVRRYLLARATLDRDGSPHKRECPAYYPGGEYTGHRCTCAALVGGGSVEGRDADALA